MEHMRKEQRAHKREEVTGTALSVALGNDKMREECVKLFSMRTGEPVSDSGANKGTDEFNKFSQIIAAYDRKQPVNTRDQSLPI